jgi:membrane-associated phospholipid phosphatase
MPANRSSGGGLIDRTDALLGALFLSSLLLIPPLEGLDRGVSRRLSQDISERNTVPRIGGRTLGTLRAGLALTGGTYVIGRIAGGSALERAGLRSLEALLVADVATRVIKIGAGRRRPTVSSSSDHFDPFKFDSNSNSFPSGHTSHVFAIATTFSMELSGEAPWVPFVAYPLAAWTATTRVLDRKHWVTDVVGGAALGILSARLVQRRHRDREEREGGLSWSIAPAGGGGFRIAVSAPFR